MTSERNSLDPHPHSETLRKLVHVAFGLLAFTLRWLPFPAALLLATSAISFNLFILPHVGGKRIARTAAGRDRGIVIYPIIVFLAILLFRGSETYIAAMIWTMLAFGDGFASLGGRALPLALLPWNPGKSWGGLIAFVIFGAVASYAAGTFVGAAPSVLPLLLVVAATTIAAAIAETLDLGLDDNVVVGVVSGAMFAWLAHWSRLPVPTLSLTSSIWLLANLVLAIAGYAAKSVNLSGLIAGIVLGSILILFAGPPLYVVLLAFFIIGSGVTRLGYGRKAAAGLAQEGGGRRGASHAFANVGVAAVLAISYAAISLNSIWLVAAIAALATAAADTTASEIGQLFGRNAFLPLTFRRVAPGTEGAISLEGTIAGALAAVATSAAGVLSYHLPVAALGICVVGAVAASYAESVVGSLNRESGISNGTLNFFNTAVGAAIAAALWAAAVAV